MLYHTLKRTKAYVSGTQGQIFFLVERIGEFCVIVVFLAVPSSGEITVHEEVRIQIRCGLCADTGTVAIKVKFFVIIVLIGPKSNLPWWFSVSPVSTKFSIRALAPKGYTEPFDLLDAMNEGIHRRLTLGESHRWYLFQRPHPASSRQPLVALSPSLEQFLGQFIKRIIAQSRRADNNRLLQEFGQRHFHNHIVNRQSPFSVGQTGVHLLHLQIIHEVDVAPLGIVRLHCFMKRAVFQNIQSPRNPSPAWLLGKIPDDSTGRAVHVDRIHNVIAVKRYGIFADRARERILQQAHLVIIDIHVGEDILQCDVQNVARLYQLVDTCGVLTCNNIPFRFGILLRKMCCVTVSSTEIGRISLLLWTNLHLVQQPFLLADKTTVQLVRRDVIHRQRQFLIFIELVIVVVLQVGALLRRNHTPHQLHGGFSSCCTVHACGAPWTSDNCFGIRDEFHINHAWGGILDQYRLRLVSHGTECEIPSRVHSME